jgi:hypothetical protein
MGNMPEYSTWRAYGGGCLQSALDIGSVALVVQVKQPVQVPPSSGSSRSPAGARSSGRASRRSPGVNSAHLPAATGPESAGLADP